MDKQTHRYTDTRTDRHWDSVTDTAQRVMIKTDMEEGKLTSTQVLTLRTTKYSVQQKMAKKSQLYFFSPYLNEGGVNICSHLEFLLAPS